MNYQQAAILLDFINTILHIDDYEETYFAVKVKLFDIKNTPHQAPPCP